MSKRRCQTCGQREARLAETERVLEATQRELALALEHIEKLEREIADLTAKRTSGVA